MKTTLLTAERVREVLSYDPDTGVFTWRKKVNRKVVIGAVAGWITHLGYRRISIDNKGYGANRLAWLYMTGEMPVHEIDHINGIRDDDAFANLRDVTHRVNLQNQRRPTANNKGTGVLGVHRHGRMYRAQIKLNGATVRLGSFHTMEAAKASYLAAKRAHHEGCTL